MLAAQAALTRETAEGDRLQGLLLSRSVTAAAFRQGSTVPRGVAAFTNTNRYGVHNGVCTGVGFLAHKNLNPEP